MPAPPATFDIAAPDTFDGAGPDEGEWEDLEARLARLEATQHEIVTAAREHEAARVRRKVVASTTGAGAAGFIPLLLQLVNALSLSPEVAATVTSAVAALGALVAGYLTPDRQPVLPPEPQSVYASPLDVAAIAPFPPRRPPRRASAAQPRPSGHACRPGRAAPRGPRPRRAGRPRTARPRTIGRPRSSPCRPGSARRRRRSRRSPAKARSRRWPAARRCRGGGADRPRRPR